MAVLSVSICTKRGNGLVSRQFVEMTRVRVEGLISAFPRLSERAVQHTYVETDSVRYVYQPLEDDIYLLLLTNRASNIVEDLGTLRLLAEVVKGVLGSINEASIKEHSVELIFAFDEIVAGGGYREDETVGSIRKNLLMKSEAEDRENRIKREQEENAKSIMEQRVAQLRRDRIKALKQDLLSSHLGTGHNVHLHPSYKGKCVEGQNDVPAAGQSSRLAGELPKEASVKGMKLHSQKKRTVDEMIQSLVGISHSKDASGFFGPEGVANRAPEETSFAPVKLSLEEKIIVHLSREGCVDFAEAKGALAITVNAGAASSTVVALNPPIATKHCTSQWNLVTHPKINKDTYEEDSTLALKEGKSLPIGRPVRILRWSRQSKEVAPCTVNCWPEDDGYGNMAVNMEVDLTRSEMLLSDVNVIVPLGTKRPPSVEKIGGLGEFSHFPEKEELHWHVGAMDSQNPTSLLEFTVPGGDADVFFPISVSFKSETLLCPVQILGVSSKFDSGKVPYSVAKVLEPEVYQCG